MKHILLSLLLVPLSQIQAVNNLITMQPKLDSEPTFYTGLIAFNATILKKTAETRKPHCCTSKSTIAAQACCIACTASIGEHATRQCLSQYVLNPPKDPSFVCIAGLDMGLLECCIRLQKKCTKPEKRKKA